MLCTKDVYEATARQVLKDRRGGRLAWKNKKAIVEALKAKNSFVDERGTVVSYFEKEQKEKLEKLEDIVSELSNSFRSQPRTKKQQ